MPTIEVDERTFQRLKTMAKFMENPNGVVSRLLNGHSQATAGTIDLEGDTPIADLEAHLFNTVKGIQHHEISKRKCEDTSCQVFKVEMWARQYITSCM